MFKAKTRKMEMIGGEDNLRKVQDLMHNYGAKCREVWPRVKYENWPDKIFFEAVFEVEEGRTDKIMKDKKLRRYCSRMATLDE